MPFLLASLWRLLWRWVGWISLLDRSTKRTVLGTILCHNVSLFCELGHLACSWKNAQISLSLLYYVRCFNGLSPNVEPCKHSLYNIMWPSCNSVYEIKCLLKKILSFISLRHICGRNQYALSYLLKFVKAHSDVIWTAVLLNLIFCGIPII